MFFFKKKSHRDVGQQQEDSCLLEIMGQSDPMGIHYKERTHYFDTKPLKQSNNASFSMIIIKSNITNQITLKLLANAGISWQTISKDIVMALIRKQQFKETTIQ